MSFHVHILRKNKVCIIHKDTPFSEKWQTVHGYVIYIANLLTSVSDPTFIGSEPQLKIRSYKFKLTKLSII